MLIQVTHPIWQKSKSSIIIQEGRFYNSALQLRFLKGQTTKQIFEWLIASEQSFRIVFSEEDIQGMKDTHKQKTYFKTAKEVIEITSAWPTKKASAPAWARECDCPDNQCQMETDDKFCLFRNRG